MEGPSAGRAARNEIDEDAAARVIWGYVEPQTLTRDQGRSDHPQQVTETRQGSKDWVECVECIGAPWRGWFFSLPGASHAPCVLRGVNL